VPVPTGSTVDLSHLSVQDRNISLAGGLGGQVSPFEDRLRERRARADPRLHSFSPAAAALAARRSLGLYPRHLGRDLGPDGAFLYFGLFLNRREPCTSGRRRAQAHGKGIV
jgi:hypothetical protein